MKFIKNYGKNGQNNYYWFYVYDISLRSKRVEETKLLDLYFSSLYLYIYILSWCIKIKLVFELVCICNE